MKRIQFTGRLHAHAVKSLHRANNEISLSVITAERLNGLKEEISGLTAKRIVLQIAEVNGADSEPMQSSLLPVEAEPQESELIVIPGQPIGKPRQTQADKWKQRPCVVQYRLWADRARKAADGKIPKCLEAV